MEDALKPMKGPKTPPTEHSQNQNAEHRTDGAVSQRSFPGTQPAESRPGAACSRGSCLHRETLLLLEETQKEFQTVENPYIHKSN